MFLHCHDMELHSLAFAGIYFATLASQSLRTWVSSGYGNTIAFNVMQFPMTRISYVDSMHDLAMSLLAAFRRIASHVTVFG